MVTTRSHRLSLLTQCVGVGTGTVSITVKDINDMPPSFTKDEWVTEVSESQHIEDLGQVLLTVTVVDQDQNNDFYYKVRVP